MTRSHNSAAAGAGVCRSARVGAWRTDAPCTTSGQSRVWDVDSAAEDDRGPGGGCLVRHDAVVRGCADEEGASVVAAQRAGDHIQVAGGNLLKDRAALLDAADALAGGVCHPDRPFGV